MYLFQLLCVCLIVHLALDSNSWVSGIYFEDPQVSISIHFTSGSED